MDSVIASPRDATHRSAERRLPRVLNALLGGAIVVGGAIGVGIMRTPGHIAGQIGEPIYILLVWLAGGLIALLGANCLAEMATALPQAGGPYVYARRAFGPFGGVAIGWADWLISVTAIATIAVTISEYIGSGSFNPIATHMLAMGVIAAFAALNWFGLEAGARTQQLLSALKVAGLVLLAVTAIVLGKPGALHTGVRGLAATPTLLVLTSAIVIIHETYAGWNSSVYFAEEDKDAAANVPKALFWGIAAITISYLLFNVGLLAILPHDVLASSKLPAADAADAIFGSSGHAIVRVFAIISLCGILNVTVMFTPRIVFAMSRDQLLPSSLSSLNRASVPGYAMITCVVPAMALAAGLTFGTLFSVTAFLGLAANLVLFASYFKLRWSEPELERPFRAWGYPWLPMLITAMSAGLVVTFVFADPFSSAIATAAILLGWPLFGWSLRHRRLNRAIH
jgi:APA family basic amino acid/polyamine antiporter